MYFLCACLVLCIFITYKWYLKPVASMKRYRDEFIKAGYRVIMLPYNPFKFSSIMIYLEDYQKHRDCFYHYKN